MFYQFLFGAALALNLGNRKMLALTMVVGAGIFAPVQDANFYLICMLGEILIGLLAYRIDAYASGVIIGISVLLAMFHAMGYFFDGYPIASPYHILVKISEHAEIFSCIILSQKFMEKRSSNVTE
jgi:hypothetical protein